MRKTLKSAATRTLVYLLAGCMVGQPAFAADVSISQVPLATSGGSGVLANLLFTLDSSGSMAYDYLPDHVNDSRQCATRSSGSSDCTYGDPGFDAGGPNGSNGNAYDPMTNYKPGVLSTGVPVTPSIGASGSPYELSLTALARDAYQAQSTSNINITTETKDVKYCNGNGLCKRNGANDAGTELVSGTDVDGNTMSAGRFPYRTHKSNASTPIFGLPEMMQLGTFSRTSGTVTVNTVEAHGLVTGDKIYSRFANEDHFEKNAQAVTVVNSTRFTYTSGSGNTNDPEEVQFRKHTSGATINRTSGSFTATVTSNSHGLVVGDVVLIDAPTGDDLSNSFAAVTAVSANTFSYVSGDDNTETSIPATWVRVGLYNQRDNTVTGYPFSFHITPIEWCTDGNLTDCVQVLPPATPPSGYTFPAYVRYCQTQGQAMAPVAIGDTGSNPRCRSKFVSSGSASGATWRWARYGWFNRSNIRSPSATPAGSNSYARSIARTDCAAAPTCTYAEEVQNYARWYTYYRTRMQMMKTAAGRAFLPFVSDPSASPVPIADKLRVGFITINPFYDNDGDSWSSAHSTIRSAQYLKVADFDTGHADLWYSKFYAQKPAKGTPLREALSRAGWIFSGKLNSGLTAGIPTTDDPVIASCQRNFTLLTTDGYWNGNNGKDLDDDPIGNADNVNPTTDAPYTSVAVDRTSTGTFDGGANTVVVTATPSTVTEQNICYGNLDTTFSNSPQTACGCPAHQHRIVTREKITNQTVTTTGGTQTSTGSTTTEVFIPGPCTDAPGTTSSQTQIYREDRLCRDRNTREVEFENGVEKSCSACSNSDRYVIIRRYRERTISVTTINGVVTESGDVTTGPTNSVYQYSTNGSGFTSFTGDTIPSITCANSAITLPLGSYGNGTNGSWVNSGGLTGSTPLAGTLLTITQSPNPSLAVVGTPTSTVTAGGYPDTLADVAMYYFRTDLRGGTDFKGNTTGPAASGASGTPDVSANDVPVKSGAKDYAAHQHMVTFSIGMVDGLMRYQSDYETAANGDFAAIKNGTADACFWKTGACDWPRPVQDTASALDDLWHAAVNGRGQYYLAKDVDALASGIQNALNAVNAQVAAAAASATSSPNVTQTDNQIFSTTYETGTWSGKVFAQTIDPTTGNVNPTIQWQADTQLLTKVAAASDTRNIYTFAGSATDKVKPFVWGADADSGTAARLSDDERAYFVDRCDPLTTMTQCSAITGSVLATANSGEALVGWLRGHSGNEGTAFRDRTFIDPSTNAVTQTVLGDTISAKPAFVRRPLFNYGGTYSSFITTHTNRSPRVYVGANDGYLHAFHADTGAEEWAYVPRYLMPGLYQLASTGFSSGHRYYVDGSPETGDVFDANALPSGQWKTILVGGNAGGGRGYFALDITDPAAPKGLWEFCSDSTLCAVSDADLGLTYGNPIIGQRAFDGKWVVVVTSGLNNSSGDGQGYFYVLDAITGEILSKTSTGVGSPTAPSGLMKASAFFTSALTSGNFRYVYAGDQLGNVWRLDVNTATPTVLKMATLKDTGGNPQPITTRPALTTINSERILYVGTGRYLGTPDLTAAGAAAAGAAWQQTMYAFRDKGADYGASLRAEPRMVQQTFRQISPTERGITQPANAVTWGSTHDGWYIDFNPSFGSPATPNSPGEGVNLVDPKLVLGTVVVTTNVPAAAGSSCAVGGSSFEYNFDFKSGNAVSTAGGVVGRSLGGTITVGVAIVQLPSGAIKAISTGADTSKTTSNVNTSASGAAVKRFSYRLR